MVKLTIMMIIILMMMVNMIKRWRRFDQKEVLLRLMFSIIESPSRSYRICNYATTICVLNISNGKVSQFESLSYTFRICGWTRIRMRIMAAAAVESLAWDSLKLATSQQSGPTAGVQHLVRRFDFRSHASQVFWHAKNTHTHIRWYNFTISKTDVADDFWSNHDFDIFDIFGICCRHMPRTTEARKKLRCRRAEIHSGRVRIAGSAVDGSHSISSWYRSGWLVFDLMDTPFFPLYLFSCARRQRDGCVEPIRLFMFAHFQFNSTTHEPESIRSVQYWTSVWVCNTLQTRNIKLNLMEFVFGINPICRLCVFAS